jgi:hypothetical protein
MRLHVLVRSAHHPEVDLKLNFTAADERREIAITIGESACLKITAIPGPSAVAHQMCSRLSLTYC